MDVFAQGIVRTALETALSLLPVVAFLGALIVMDSFKLVPMMTVLRIILAGAVVAALCMFANERLLATFAMDTPAFTRYVAPAVEEFGKYLVIVFLLRTGRVAFLVDTSILGFAAGTGFAVVENIYYLNAVESTTLLLWVVRGFGTAVMHGGTMIIAGVITKSIIDRQSSSSLPNLVPGFLAAYIVHSAFNHFVLPPLLMTATLLIVLPLLVLVVFQRGEQATMKWLGTGMDADLEIFQLISEGRIANTAIGTYLESLRDRFAGEIVADMLCYLELYAELSIRAKSLLLMKKHGVDAPRDPALKDHLDELAYLDENIGPTGKLAMAPILHIGQRELWQLRMLADEHV